MNIYKEILKNKTYRCGALFPECSLSFIQIYSYKFLNNKHILLSISAMQQQQQQQEDQLINPKNTKLRVHATPPLLPTHLPMYI